MTSPIHNSQSTIHNPQILNPATILAETFVSALAASGLRHACIAPGSRSTPLTLAFAAHPDIEVHLHLDERAGGFFALGMALATAQPVALVCTSGTAVANFLPAIVEARMSHVPLLVLTADRPPELRHSGANQTIDQVKIYGDQVLWAVDAPLPQNDPPDVVLRHLRTLAARAYATANGLMAGPVHVNFPFRKPLEPVISDQLSVSGKQPTETPIRLPATEHRLPNTDNRLLNTDNRLLIQRGHLIATRTQTAVLAEIINRHERGLIVCGPRCPGGNFPAAVAGLAQISGYPIMADPLSGVRWGTHTAGTVVCGGYETYLQGDPGWPAPQVILRFGAVPTSKWLNDYLTRCNPLHRIHVRENGVWSDDSHLTTHLLQVNEELLCFELAHQVTPRMETTWTRQVQDTESALWQQWDQHLFEPYGEMAVVADVVAAMPENGRLFAGNSLPIRHLDQFARPLRQRIQVYGNRGASGIDGNTSTALGIAAGGNTPLVAVLGDVTFYHDLTGLYQITRRWGTGESGLPPFTIVLLNNNGGNIFRRLPVSAFEPPFTELFLTPHDLDFAGVLQTFGLAHEVPEGRGAFQAALAASLHSNRPTIIEIRTDGASDENRRRELVKAFNNG